MNLSLLKTMDELFDRIKAIRFKRHNLFLTLIATEIFGILILVWFLRIPLSQKYLTTPPKAYSLIAMNPTKRYLVSQGDLLQGKGIPNTNLAILLTPGKVRKSIQTNSEGNFVFQIPLDIEPRIYQVTITNFGKDNNLTSARGYRIRVQTNNKILQNKLLRTLFNKLQIKNAQALDGTPGTDYDWERLIGPDWVDWLKLWYQTGICPAIDDYGEIIYLNKQVFDEIYPGYICDAYESLDKWLEAMQRDEQFFVQLYIKLNGDGWPEESFIDYFPGWKQYLAENRAIKLDTIPRAAYKHYGETIDEETLTDYIKEVLITSNLREKSSQLRILTNYDPLLNTRAMYNVYYDYKFKNNWDRIDAILGLLTFIPASVADRAAYKLSIESYNAEKAARIIARNRRSIKEGAILTQDQMIPKAGEIAIREYDDQVARYIQLAKDQGVKVPKDSYAQRHFYDLRILNLVRSGKAVLAEDILGKEVVKDLKSRVENTVGEIDSSSGRHIFSNESDQGMIYLAPRKNIQELPGMKDSEGLAEGDIIILPREWVDENPEYLRFALVHELHHGFAVPINDFKGFNWGGEDFHDEFLSKLVEFSTDILSHISYYGRAFPFDVIPEETKLSAYYGGSYSFMRQAFQKIENDNPEMLEAVKRFQIHVDADILFEELSTNQKLREFCEINSLELRFDNFTAILYQYLSNVMGIDFSKTVINGFVNKYILVRTFPAIVYFEDFVHEPSKSNDSPNADQPPEDLEYSPRCEYEEWETEYECKDGQACYNLFYSSNTTYCQPEARIVDDKHYRCAPEERCNNPETTAPGPLPPEEVAEPETDYPSVPVDGVE